MLKQLQQILQPPLKKLWLRLKKRENHKQANLPIARSRRRRSLLTEKRQFRPLAVLHVQLANRTDETGTCMTSLCVGLGERRGQQRGPDLGGKVFGPVVLEEFPGFDGGKLTHGDVVRCLEDVDEDRDAEGGFVKVVAEFFGSAVEGFSV